MTKSFTAAAVLGLRDAGRLALDDAAAGTSRPRPGSACPAATRRRSPSAIS